MVVLVQVGHKYHISAPTPEHIVYKLVVTSSVNTNDPLPTTLTIALALLWLLTMVLITVSQLLQLQLLLLLTLKELWACHTSKSPQESG